MFQGSRGPGGCVVVFQGCRVPGACVPGGGSAAGRFCFQEGCGGRGLGRWVLERLCSRVPGVLFSRRVVFQGG